MLILYASAHPIPPADTTVFVNDTVETMDWSGSDHCRNIRNCRTAEQIIFSCIAVVFVCTWVAVHPNIPRKFYWRGAEIVGDSLDVHSAVVTLQNILFMLLALIVPELIIMWAIRQWLAARAIGKKYATYNWTKTHGFFVVMGGFALYDGEKYLSTLEDKEWFTEMERAAAIKIDGELEDKFIEGYLKEEAEQLIFTQGKRAGGEGEQTGRRRRKSVLPGLGPRTNRPGVQGATRKEERLVIKEGKESVGSIVYRLPNGSASCLLELLLIKKLISVTEDEIQDRGKRDTLSKFITIGQTTWFIAQCIARRVAGIKVTNLEILTVAFALLNFGTYFFWLDKPQRVRFPIKINCSSVTQDQRSEQRGTAVSEWWGVGWSIWSISRLRAIWDWFRAIDREIGSDWVEVISDWEPGYVNGPFYLIPLLVILYPLLTLLNQSSNLTAGRSHYESGLKKDPRCLYMSVLTIAVMFGAIHCIPWNFTFPSHTEQIMWRFCALGVTCLPVLGIVLPVAVGEITISVSGRVVGDWDVPESFKGFCAWILIFSSILYIIARITLIILALMKLRALPPDAYQTVEWTTFIPHI
ncbi:hypothetical protein D9758_016368 [Tetrapyrgos nigripes]|uniref:Uncharacterized protein n=1 Tax=Tetrapyrgos nigripes TaxID=182062 RepID=A0A8H5CCW6_9AGAR|nr:hypothetical protein D9758_016368 [Tetrapyrgos nigripes]